MIRCRHPNVGLFHTYPATGICIEEVFCPDCGFWWDTVCGDYDECERLWFEYLEEMEKESQKTRI